MLPATTLILAVLCLGLFVVAGFFFNLWRNAESSLEREIQAEKFFLESFSKASSERDDLLRRIQGKAAQESPEHRSQRRFSGALIRRMNDADNARIARANEPRPNSEILAAQEQENG